MDFKPKQTRTRGFTLIEVLCSMAIIATLVGISVFALSKANASKLTSAGNMLVDQINLSRQTAVTKNCLVEFRIYELPEPLAASNAAPTVYRAFQAFMVDNAGASTAITKTTFLPDGVKIFADESVSSLLKVKSPPFYTTGSTSGLPMGSYPPSSYNYYAFHFKPDGSTDLDPTAAQSWHLSLALTTDPVQTTNNLPANFLTVQIDPQNGKTRSFRPN